MPGSIAGFLLLNCAAYLTTGFQVRSGKGASCGGSLPSSGGLSCSCLKRWATAASIREAMSAADVGRQAGFSGCWGPAGAVVECRGGGKPAG